jgi:hypothetical protein
MAARHYSVPHFFRQMPNSLLKRYFARHELFGDVDFEKMLETKPEELLNAWGLISNEKRRAIEPQLREIFDLACVRGVHAIRDAAQSQLTEEPEKFATFVEGLQKRKNHYERAMATFLDHQAYWSRAVKFCHADSLSFWRKRRGLPTKAAAIDQPSLTAMEAEIGRWFSKAEGRGRNCQVEVLRRNGRDYFFALPEDFANEVIEWDGTDLLQRPHSPAFEVVFVWTTAEGSLDFNYRGTPKAKDAMLTIFARHALKLEKLPPAPKDGRIYHLDRLKRREFPFVYEAGSGIKTVSVRALRLSSTVRRGDRMKLEADTSEDRLALYDLVDQVGQAIPLGQWNVTQAEIVARLVATDEKPERDVAFTVSYPNSCSLEYEGTALTLRTMLVASGIEPQ